MTHKLKIAIFHELDSGGARRGVNEFAFAFKKMGHTVDLYFTGHVKDEKENKYFSSTHYYEFVPKIWTGGNWKSKLYKDTVELYKLYLLHKKIAKELEEEKYTFVFVHGSKFTQAPFILRFLKSKKIYYCQEPLRMVYESLFAIPANIHPLKQLYEGFMRYIRKKIDEKNIHCSDMVFANSSFTKNNIYNAYGLNAIVCHMGVDTAVFYPTLKKSADILFIGAKDSFDGYPLFQESIKYMNEKAKITYLIRGENWVADDSLLRDYYSQSRIVICFGFLEPFGLIPLEAMACGSVVVALNEGGYKDSISNNKTGILVGKNPQEIARVLDDLLCDSKVLNKLSESAMIEIKKYWTWERGANQILKQCKKN